MISGSLFQDENQRARENTRSHTDPLRRVVPGIARAAGRKRPASGQGRESEESSLYDQTGLGRGVNPVGFDYALSEAGNVVVE